MSNTFRKFHIALLAALLAACGGEDEPLGFEAGPLGSVEIGAGEAVQIRSLLSITGAASLGGALRNGVELAVRDFGDVHGRAVELGESMDSMCSPDGGRAGAEQISADPQVIGVIGTSCSAAAVAASPVISEAGLVMICAVQHVAVAHVRPRWQRQSQLPPRLFPHFQQRPLSGERSRRLRL